jgi:hypothetical protein
MDWKRESKRSEECGKKKNWEMIGLTKFLRTKDSLDATDDPRIRGTRITRGCMVLKG